MALHELPCEPWALHGHFSPELEPFCPWIRATRW